MICKVSDLDRVIAIVKEEKGRLDVRFASFLASDDSSYVTGTELFVDGSMAQV